MSTPLYVLVALIRAQTSMRVTIQYMGVNFGSVYIGHPIACELYRDSQMQYTTIDCSQEHWQEACVNTGLFATAINIIHAEEMVKDDASLLLGVLHASPANRAEGTKLHKDILKIIEQEANVHDLSIKPRDLNIKVWQTIGKALGVNLSIGALKELNSHVGHDPDRALSIVRAISIGGWSDPTTKQIAILAGTSCDAGLPWDVLRLAETKQWDQVRSDLVNLDPIPTIAYIGKRCATALVLCNAPDISDLNLDMYVGDTSTYARNSAKEFAGRLGEHKLKALAKAVVYSDKLAKRGHGHVALIALFGALSSLMSS